MGLNAVEMDEIGDLVNQAFLTAFSNARETIRDKLLHFSFGLIKQEVPYFLFSGQVEGTKRLVGLMYDDPDIRDYVLQITMHVFAKFGNVKGRYEALVENLAEAIGYIQPPPPKSNKDAETSPVAMTPPELLDRLPTSEDVTDVLLYNRWAVTMVLMMLYLMTPDDLSALLIEKRQRDAAEAAEQARQLKRPQSVAA